MAIESAITARLTGFAGLSALIGTRVYPLQAPQNADTPFVSYQRISSVRIRSFDGPSGVAQPRFQFDCFGTTYASATAVANQVRLALDGFKGEVMSDDSPSVSLGRIMASSLDDDRDFIEAETNPKLYRVSMDFIILHEE